MFADLNGKGILVISEQGFGDTVQFARYAYELSDFYKTDIFFFAANPDLGLIWIS